MFVFGSQIFLQCVNLFDFGIASPDQEIIRAGSIPGKHMYILTKGHLGIVHYPAKHMRDHHNARFKCQGVEGPSCHEVTSK